MSSSPITGIIPQPEGIEVPGWVRDLASFRRWAASDAFPESGRIDYVQGRLEIDMSPEEGNTHGSLKTALAIVLGQLIDYEDRGVVYIDRMRYTCEEAGLSVEPDVLVALFDSIEAGRVRIGWKVGQEGQRFRAIEGTADLVVEVVSETSVRKDTRQLPERYQQAGVREYWIVDARGEEIQFELLSAGPAGFVPAVPDSAGYRDSPVLGCAVRITRLAGRAGIVRYRLETA